MLESVSPASSYGAARPFCGTVMVRAAVDKMGEELFVRAEVHATLEAVCARCLEPCEVPVAARFEALYVPARGGGLDEEAGRRAEWEARQTVYFSGGLADLGPQVVEALELAEPPKPLCRQDCRGLCPRCGRNLNQGPCDCPRADDFGRPFKRLFEPRG